MNHPEVLSLQKVLIQSGISVTKRRDGPWLTKDTNFMMYLKKLVS